jgi:hypothetical protein
MGVLNIKCYNKTSVVYIDISPVDIKFYVIFNHNNKNKKILMI